MTIAIAAGHSNKDPGSTGNGLIEAQVVTEFRNLVANFVKAAGIEVRLDGEDQVNQDLNTSAKIAATAKIAVEFHTNAFSSPTATGVETLSYPKDYPLCRELCATISKVLGIANRGAKPHDSGQHKRPLYIVGGQGIICELFFISNPKDVASYLANKEILAKAVADVLVSFYRS